MAKLENLKGLEKSAGKEEKPQYHSPKRKKKKKGDNC